MAAKIGFSIFIFVFSFPIISSLTSFISCTLIGISISFTNSALNPNELTASTSFFIFVTSSSLCVKT